MKLTRRATVAGGAGLLSILLVACGGTSEEATQTPPTSAAESTTDAEGGEVDTAHNDADTAFAQMMIIHHEGAIEMADLAVHGAGAPEVHTLAEGISAAQGPEIEEMTSWLEAWGEETAPMDDVDGMDGMDHGGMHMEGMSQDEAMAELEELPDGEFDQRFLELMIDHHRGAVEMAQDQLDHGENPQALDLAQRVVDDQTTEIALMEEMLQDL